MPCKPIAWGAGRCTWTDTSSSTLHSFLLLSVDLQFARKGLHVRLWKARRPSSCFRFPKSHQRHSLAQSTPDHFNIKCRPLPYLRTLRSKARLEPLDTHCQLPGTTGLDDLSDKEPKSEVRHMPADDDNINSLQESRSERSSTTAFDARIARRPVAAWVRGRVSSQRWRTRIFDNTPLKRCVM